MNLTCLEGNAILSRGPIGPLVLTGKRKRPDNLFWTLLGKTYRHDQRAKEMAVSIQGLYRGRYCDAIIEARELYNALIELGQSKHAEQLAAACSANGVNLK